MEVESFSKFCYSLSGILAEARQTRDEIHDVCNQGPQAISHFKKSGRLLPGKKVRSYPSSPLGNLAVLSPPEFELEETRREKRKILQASGLAADDLRKDLKEDREKLFKKKYGRKIHWAFSPEETFLSRLIRSIPNGNLPTGRILPKYHKK